MDEKLLHAMLSYPSFHSLEAKVSRAQVLQFCSRDVSSQMLKSVGDVIRRDETSPTIFTREVYLHELAELASYAELGRLQAILNGESNEDVLENANCTAKIAEIKFFQSMCQYMFNKDIPYGAAVCAHFALPELGFDIDIDIYGSVRFGGGKDIFNSFSIDDVLLGVKLLELGGCDVSQVYKAIRKARLQNRSTEPITHDGTTVSMPDKYLKREDNLRHPIDASHWITGYGIEFADIENDIFLGWIEVTSRRLGSPEFHLPIIRWNSIPHEQYGIRIISSTSEYGDGIYHPSVQSFINNRLDVYCAEKLGLVSPQNKMNDIGIIRRELGLGAEGLS